MLPTTLKGGIRKKMPKAISIPPPIPKELIPAEGVDVTIINARIVRDQWTTIGTLKLGLGINVEFDDGEYSQLFSLDKDILTGSVGRILVSVGLEDVSEDIKDEDVQVLVGKVVKLRKRGDKLYWYP